EVVPDIHVALWDKFLFVVGWGGVGAVTRAPVGVLRELPQTQGLLRQSMTEIAVLAKARGVNLPADQVEKSLGFLNTLPPEGTTSMQRDIMEGKPSELESWNGAVVRLAKESGVAVPLHEFVYSSLLPQEHAARTGG
ncbi:ketopantoate reductase family protein, partial [Sedimenticola sp.]|uniref:ketopantoate reductase family protein n=1 Tax=Sedimenticola sp. TaxID=1940285 RepID=UPI003D145D39